MSIRRIVKPAPAAAQLKALLGAAPEPLVVSTPSFKCLGVNQSYAELVGVAARSLVGKSPLDGAPLPDPRRCPALAALARQGRPAGADSPPQAGEQASDQPIETDVTAADGKRIAMLANARLARLGGRLVLVWSGHRMGRGEAAGGAVLRYARELRRVIDASRLRLRVIGRDGRFILYEGLSRHFPSQVDRPLGHHFEEVLGDLPSLLEHCRRALAGERSMTTMFSDDFPSDANYIPLYNRKGEVWAAAILTADATLRVKAARELDARIRQQAAAAELGRRALEDPPLEELLDLAAQRIMQALETDFAVVLELSPDQQRLQFRAGAGWPPGLVGELVLDSDNPSVSGLTLMHHEPVVFTDLASETRFMPSPVLTDHGVTSGLSVPLIGRNHVYGSLAGFSRRRREFSGDDINFLRALAGVIGGAIARERAAVELAHSERFFRRLVESTSDVVRVTNRAGVVLFESGASRQIFGYEPEALVGQTAYRLFHPAQVEFAISLMEEAFEHPGALRTAELKMRHANGDYRAAEIVYHAVPDTEGELVLIATIRDVTERRRSEAEQQLLASIVQSSDQAIVSRNLANEVLSWNPAAERLYGHSAAEALGTTLSTTSPECQEREDAGLARALSGQRGEEFESRRLSKDGTPLEVAVSFSPIRDDLQQITGVTSISYDITDRKLAERARELTQVNTDLEQFAAVVSHDLQEPLRTIRAYVRLLGEHMGPRLEAESAEFMRYILDAAEWMQSLIRDLLAYSTVTSAAHNYQAVDLHHEMERVRANLAMALAEHQAELIHGQLPRVMGDPLRLVQLLQNLISNAVKFHRPAVRPRVELSAELTDQGWQISVRDNGIGLDPAHAERIFSPFERLHSREEYPGTGIGLAICRKIVERHGGRIWVESRPGEGATFHFLLRDASSQEEGPEQEESSDRDKTSD